MNTIFGKLAIALMGLVVTISIASCLRWEPILVSPDNADLVSTDNTDGEIRADLPPFYWSKKNYTEGKYYKERASVKLVDSSAHQELADLMQKFDEKECRLFYPAVRAVCPIMGNVKAVTQQSDGVQLIIDSENPIKAIVAHMRCHHQFAETQAYHGMDECPLYLRGITITEFADEKTVEISSHDPTIVKEIQQRSHRHVQK